MFEVGLSPKPVYRDGRTSDLTYVILAAKPAEQYNAVVSTPGGGVLKFYPNAQFWGVTDAVVKTLLGPGYSIYSRASAGYEGIHYAEKPGVVKFLDLIRKQRGAVVVDNDQFLKVDTAYGTRTDGRAMHPQTHGVPSEKHFPEWAGARIP